MTKPARSATPPTAAAISSTRSPSTAQQLATETLNRNFVEIDELLRQVNPELEWDFRLEQVRSINVSNHKFGLVYPAETRAFSTCFPVRSLPR
jgi:hypothetical protein